MLLPRAQTAAMCLFIMWVGRLTGVAAAFSIGRHASTYVRTCRSLGLVRATGTRTAATAASSAASAQLLQDVTKTDFPNCPGLILK